MILIIGMLPVHTSYAGTAEEIDVCVDVALGRFVKEVNCAKEFLEAATTIATALSTPLLNNMEV
ncbi:MAG: hypothetical protein WC560_07225 [Syntrophales bacterium]